MHYFDPLTIIAVAPSMLLTWASVSWFKNTIQGRSNQKMKKVGLPMRETLRFVDREHYFWIE
jgi:nuclear-control-of-ATPase protein 2